MESRKFRRRKRFSAREEILWRKGAARGQAFFRSSRVDARGAAEKEEWRGTH